MASSHLVIGVAAFGAGVYCAKTYLGQPKSEDEKEETHKPEEAATGGKEKHGDATAGPKDEKKKKHKQGEGAAADEKKEKHKAKKGKSDDSNRRSKKDKKKDKSGHRADKKKGAEPAAPEAAEEQSTAEASQADE